MMPVRGGQYLNCRRHVFLCSSRLPEDGTPEPKHVVDDIHHELYFMVYILPSSSVGWVDILHIRKYTLVVT